MSMGQDEEKFAVHVMLDAAVNSGSAMGTVTAACVPEEAQATFRGDFENVVETMLRKTSRSMQQGLRLLADSVVRLLQACSCGEIIVLDNMKEHASRLSVFAASSGILNIGSKVSYEPLKALTVAGIDIHAELNALLVAWKLNKGANEVGRSLKVFMEQFRSEETEKVAPAATHEHVAPAADPYGRETPHFWKVALNAAFKNLGDASLPITEACVDKATAKELSDGIEAAFESMLEKTKRSMQSGLKQVADVTLSSLSRVEALCTTLTSSVALRHLRSAASRVTVFATAKTLMNFGVHVEYEAMKTLKVGGIDIHREVNQLIGSWRLNHGPEQVGQNLASFLQDFSEVEGAKPAEAVHTPGDELMSQVIRDAISAADKGADAQSRQVSPSCFPEDHRQEFERGVNAALDHILKKRKRTMQVGLRELADATDQLFRSASTECAASPGAQTIWKAAKKLQRLTRRTVVDYGTHIKYEAMKSLHVGGVAIHAEINAFIGAWSLGNQRESGAPFGQMMLKCSQIAGHDEM